MTVGGKLITQVGLLWRKMMKTNIIPATSSPELWSTPFLRTGMTVEEKTSKDNADYFGEIAEKLQKIDWKEKTHLCVRAYKRSLLIPRKIMKVTIGQQKEDTWKCVSLTNPWSRFFLCSGMTVDKDKIWIESFMYWNDGGRHKSRTE